MPNLQEMVFDNTREITVKYCSIEMHLFGMLVRSIVPVYFVGCLPIKVKGLSPHNSDENSDSNLALDFSWTSQKGPTSGKMIFDDRFIG